METSSIRPTATTAIIVVNYRTPWHTQQCLESVFKYTQDFHLFLVQNSQDAESMLVGQSFKEKFPDLITIIQNPKNLGYVGGVNSAYSSAVQFERVCFLNSDIIVTRNWLKELNRVFDENPDVVQVCPDTNNHYPEGAIWKTIRKLPFGLSKLYKYQMVFGSPRSKQKGADFNQVDLFYFFPGGYCNLVRSEHFRDLGYFLDPNIIHGYWDDFDLSYYLRQFGRVGSTNNSYVFHFLNTSFNKVNESKKGMKERLKQLNGLYVMNKWQDRLKADLANIPFDQVLAAVNTSYVMQMTMYYLGLTTVNPDFESYIKSVPAKEIGEEFLN